MVKLLNAFGRTKTCIDNSDYIIFESSINGTYTKVMPRKTKCGIICVGGGVGGFSAKVGFAAYDPGHPRYDPYTGIMASSGGSGGYSYSEHTFEAGDTVDIFVGKGGTAYASSSLYGVITPSYPSLTLGNVSGTASRIIVGNSLVLSADSGTPGRMYFTNPSDPNTVTFDVSVGGTGATQNGNNGSVSGNGSNLYLNGGAAVYDTYGTGGPAGFSGNNQTGTPWANNGTDGYVKMFVLPEDEI